jgi:hypothetical protein
MPGQRHRPPALRFSVSLPDGRRVERAAVPSERIHRGFGRVVPPRAD